jgi:hypothetical protein
MRWMIPLFAAIVVPTINACSGSGAYDPFVARCSGAYMCSTGYTSDAPFRVDLQLVNGQCQAGRFILGAYGQVVNRPDVTWYERKNGLGFDFDTGRDVSCSATDEPRGACTGTPSSCSGASKNLGCRSIKGCYASYDGSEFYCDGTPNACELFTDKTQCGFQGCTWELQ